MSAALKRLEVDTATHQASLLHLVMLWLRRRWEVNASRPAAVRLTCRAG